MNEELEGQMALFPEPEDADEECECDQCANGGYIDDWPTTDDDE